ncbi:MAG: hypothetical protein ACYTFW_16000 [Planctomycetota bacterium]
MAKLAMGVAPKKELSLSDSTCIIMGVVIGANAYWSWNVVHFTGVIYIC